MLHNNVPVAVVVNTDEPQLSTTVTDGVDMLHGYETICKVAVAHACGVPLSQVVYGKSTVPTNPETGVNV